MKEQKEKKTFYLTIYFSIEEDFVKKKDDCNSPKKRNNQSEK
jgi:hypothetical protein